MESSEHPESPETATDATESEDLEKLESEVKEMAEKLLRYRETLPNKLKNTFSSVLAAQRPVFRELSVPGTPGEPDPVLQTTGVTLRLMR
ncbi:hypothetical protein TIFTF001_014088 [Ficus carica]|uniref:Uncharacterized protein n=1 Tax=Ficus carica TaxID=3494 RepID=A0AA88A5G1_FICCA|nr:hypothetical protein TIFTF001_014088 [Ficus carica]